LRKTEAYQAITRKRDQLNKELMVVLEQESAAETIRDH
jgi:hypothetical protein